MPIAQSRTYRSLNANHMKFAWASLFSVAFADFYVFLLATDTISDLRFF